MVKNKKKTKAKLKKFIPKKRFNRFAVIVSILLVAILGVTLTHFIFANSYNSNDEKIQYADINYTRISNGRPMIPATKCLNSIARAWSAHLSSASINSTTANLAHNPNLTSQISSKCGQWSWVAENVGVAGNSCTNPPSDGCSQAIYNGFVSAKEISDYYAGKFNHYSNIIAPQAVYVGVGAYRDSKGRLWITHDFMQCYCALATYSPVAWYLTSSATVSSSTAARASNITAKRGQVVANYVNVHNWGPNTASYSLWITTYHYSSTGVLLSSSKINSLTASTGSGQVYSHAYNITIPSTAIAGEKYCHVIFYGAATGPGTAGSHSNKSCATVTS